MVFRENISNNWAFGTVLHQIISSRRILGLFVRLKFHGVLVKIHTSAEYLCQGRSDSSSSRLSLHLPLFAGG